MSNKHTQGPWHQGSGDYQYCVYDKKCWINPDGSRGGETPNLVVVVSPESAVADARLIAAAPELLEAAIAAEQALRYLAGTLHADRLAAVIAKATGGAA